MALAKRDIAGMDGSQFAGRKAQLERAVAIEAVKPALDELAVTAMDRERGSNSMSPGKPRLGKQ